MDRRSSQHLMQEEGSVGRVGKNPQEPGLANIDRELIGLLGRYRTSIAVKYGLPGVSEKASLGGDVSSREKESADAGSKMSPGVMAGESSPISLASVDEEDGPQPMPPKDGECTPTSTTNHDHRLNSLAGAGAAIPPPPPLPQEGFNLKIASSVSPASAVKADKPQHLTPKGGECTPTSTTNHDYRLVSPEEAGAAIPPPPPLPQEGFNLKIASSVSPAFAVKADKPQHLTPKGGEGTPTSTTNHDQCLVSPEEAGAAIPPPPPLPRGKIIIKAPLHMTEELQRSGRHPETDKIGSPLENDRYNTSRNMYISARIIAMSPATKPDKGAITWGASEQPKCDYFAIPKRPDVPSENSKTTVTNAAQQLIRVEGACDGIPQEMSSRKTTMTPTTNVQQLIREEETCDGIPLELSPRDPTMTPTTDDVQQLIREERTCDGNPLVLSSEDTTMTPTTNDVLQLIREVETCDGIPLELSPRDITMTPTTDDFLLLIREVETCDGIPLELSPRDITMTPTTDDVLQLIREVETCDGIPLEMSLGKTTMTPTTNDVQQLIREDGTCDSIPVEMSLGETTMTPATNDVQQLIREEGTCDGIPVEMSSGEITMTRTTDDVQQLIRERGACDGIPLELSSRDTTMTPTTNDVQQLIREGETCDGIPAPPSFPRGGIHIKSPLHMKGELSTRKAFMNEGKDQIRVNPEDEDLTSRTRRRMWRSAGKPKKDEITWGQFEQPTIDYFVIPKRDRSALSDSDSSQPIPVSAKTVRPAHKTKALPKPCDRTLRQQNTKGDSPDDTLHNLEMSLDVIKEEVRQECIAKGMRPQFIGDLYLTRLAKARKAAAETKARKPEPRVKVEKPVHLDTDLMYAVRQRVKETLPKFVGKNNSAAMMLMADGMFQEMSLDRELDDLAWPHDPLAELKQSGLGNVDYMDPTPGNTATKQEMQSSSVDDGAEPQQCRDVARASVDHLDQSLKNLQAASMSDGFYLTKQGLAMLEYYTSMDDVSIDTDDADILPVDICVPDMHDSEESSNKSVSYSSPLDEQESVIPVDKTISASGDVPNDEDVALVREDDISSGSTTEETTEADGVNMKLQKESTSDHEADVPNDDSDVDSALSDDGSVISYVSYLGFDKVPATNKVMRKIHALERRSTSRRRSSGESMSSTSSDSSGYEGDSSSMCVHHKIKYFNKMKRSWQMSCKDQSRDQAVSVGSSATSFGDDRITSGFSDDGSSMDSGDEDFISRPQTPSSRRQLDEEPTVPLSVTSKVRLFEQFAAEELVKPSDRISGSWRRGDAKMKISLFEGITHNQKSTSAKPEGAVKSDTAKDCPLNPVDVRGRVSMFEAMKSREPIPTVSQPITRKNGGGVLVEENEAFYEELENLIIDRREKEFAL